jgi:N-acetylated-alpha-linked acidic dipeptidase
MAASDPFGASAGRRLKQFVRDVTKSVPSPKGGTVYEVWKKASEKEGVVGSAQDAIGGVRRAPAAQTSQDAPVGDLGSGSDYTVFLQRLGVPATDISSSGNYGVYHSVFDNFAWFKKFGDPDFVYEQQMARVYGLQMIRMADVDILPYQYDDYAKEIGAYIGAAQAKAQNKWAEKTPQFGAVLDAAKHFQEAGAKIAEKQRKAPADAVRLNAALRDAERALLVPEGLAQSPLVSTCNLRSGQYTGYAAVVIPGVNEAIDQGDLERTQK